MVATRRALEIAAAPVLGLSTLAGQDETRRLDHGVVRSRHAASRLQVSG